MLPVSVLLKRLNKSSWVRRLCISSDRREPVNWLRPRDKERSWVRKLSSDGREPGILAATQSFVSSLYSRRPGLQGRQEKKKLKKQKHEVLPYTMQREPLYSIYSISTHPHRIGDFNNERVMCRSIFPRWPPLSSSETNAAISQVMEQPPLQY